MVASFATFGLFWGSWAVMLFNIQHTFSLNDAQLGLLLAVAIAVAGASSAVMAHFCDRVGARRLLWIALFAWSVLLCVLALTHDTWSFGVVLVLVEVAGGSIDTAMNAEASHRLVSSPKSLMRLHALFNTGALTGAAVAALRHPRRRLVALGLAGDRRRGARRRHLGPGDRSGRGVGAQRTDARRAGSTRPATRCDACDATACSCCWRCSPWRRSPRAASTRGACCTCATTWPRACCSGPGPTSSGQLVATTTRGAGGQLLGRLSTRKALITGGCVAGAGILLESLTSVSGVAALGLALGAGGASLFWPLVMSTVSRMASQVVSAVGAFTAAGYVGWVAGAPIVGWISQNLGAGPRPPGPGPGLLRRRRVHPAEPPAQGSRAGQRVA